MATPTIILQPLTGLYLIHLAGFPTSSKWITHSILLFALGVAGWLPVVWLQIRRKAFAHEAVENNGPLPPVYWRYMTWWVLLGIPAFFAFVFVFYLMVAKPA